MGTVRTSTGAGGPWELENRTAKRVSQVLGRGMEDVGSGKTRRGALVDGLTITGNQISGDRHFAGKGLATCKMARKNYVERSDMLACACIGEYGDLFRIRSDSKVDLVLVCRTGAIIEINGSFSNMGKVAGARIQPRH